jgi:hypothetical protein
MVNAVLLKGRTPGGVDHGMIIGGWRNVTVTEYVPRREDDGGNGGDDIIRENDRPNAEDHEGAAATTTTKTTTTSSSTTTTPTTTVNLYDDDVNDEDYIHRTDDFDDSVIRIENCPHAITVDDVRHLLSRYELLERDGAGPSVYRWLGRTVDSRQPSDPTYIVRMKDPSWARAAIRENQNLHINGKFIKLIQYPRQLRKGQGVEESRRAEREIRTRSGTV